MCFGEGTIDGVRPEDLYTVNELRRRCPTRPALNTVYRWINPGLGGVRLRAVRVGGRICTCDPWAMDFFDRQGMTLAAARPAAGAVVRRTATAGVRTPTQHDRAVARAARRLASKGYNAPVLERGVLAEPPPGSREG